MLKRAAFLFKTNWITKNDFGSNWKQKTSWPTKDGISLQSKDSRGGRALMLRLGHRTARYWSLRHHRLSQHHRKRRFSLSAQRNAADNHCSTSRYRPWDRIEVCRGNQFRSSASNLTLRAKSSARRQTNRRHPKPPNDRPRRRNRRRPRQPRWRTGKIASLG